MPPICLRRSLTHTLTHALVAGVAPTPRPLIPVSAQALRSARSEHRVRDALGMLKKKGGVSPAGPPAHQPPMELQQGTCILLKPQAIDDLAIEGLDPAALSIRPKEGDQGQSELMFQVIGVDHSGDRCWLRRWPLARHGSPVFEISLHQLEARRHHRPAAGVRGGGEA
jgi:hypothetical protein